MFGTFHLLVLLYQVIKKSLTFHNKKVCTSKNNASYINFIMKQSRIGFKQTMSPMLMQNSWKIIMQIQNDKTKNILHADGYNLMYHKLILLSMKYVKQRK